MDLLIVSSVQCFPSSQLWEAERTPELSSDPCLVAQQVRPREKLLDSTRGHHSIVAIVAQAFFPPNLSSFSYISCFFHLHVCLGRLVRLIPSDPDHDDSEKAAIKTFFNHRLPKSPEAAKHEWLQIVEADHALWTNISTAKKELIRSFLNLINFEILKRLRPSSTFDFTSASIGNLFLTG